MELNSTVFQREREGLCLDWIGIAFNTCLQLVFNVRFQQPSNKVWSWLVKVFINHFYHEKTPTTADFTPNLQFKVDPLDINHMQCEGLFKNMFEYFMDGLKKVQKEPTMYSHNESVHAIPFFTVLNTFMLITTIIIFFYDKIIHVWKTSQNVESNEKPKEIKSVLKEVTELDNVSLDDEINAKDEVIVKDETNENIDDDLDFIPLYLKLKEEKMLKCEPNLGLQIETKKFVSLLKKPNPLIIKPLKLKSITNIVQPKEMNLKITKSSLKHTLRSKTMDLN